MFSAMVSGMDNKRKSKINKYAVLIIAIAVLMIIMAVIINTQFITQVSNSQMKIPTVNTTVRSSSDGSSHNVTADFSVDVEKKSQKKMSAEEIQISITKAIEKIDYDKLSEKGSLEEVRSLVQSEVEKLYPNITINKIYISNFITDNYIKNPDKDKVDERLKKFQVK